VRRAAQLSPQRAAVAARQPWRCQQCGTEEPATAHRMRNKYCSNKCVSEAYRVRLRGAANPKYGADCRTSHECRSCKKIFMARPSSSRIYCSMDCCHAWTIVEGRRNLEMGFKNRVDANQQVIVDALRASGASVEILSNLGRGMPDLIVGIPGNNILMEVKNPKTSYGKRGLSKLQKVFAGRYLGPFFVVTSAEEALRAIEEVRGWLRERN
jgi:hypothetical protein